MFGPPQGLLIPVAHVIEVVQLLLYTGNMPTLQRFPDCRVLMYLGDHPPPHVHVVRRDGRDCVVEIESLLVIGKLASREVRDALKWIEGQRLFLLSEWQRYNP